MWAGSAPACRSCKIMSPANAGGGSGGCGADAGGTAVANGAKGGIPLHPLLDAPVGVGSVAVPLKPKDV